MGMHLPIATLVTQNDLRTYFIGDADINSTSPTGWKVTNFDDAKIFNATNDKFGVNIYITASSPSFMVKAEAVDDPSDKLEIETRDPIKDLEKFFSEGLPEGAFSDLASKPTLLSKLIIKIASGVRVQSIGPRKTSAILRRLMLAAQVKNWKSEMNIGLGLWMVELKDDMKKKGWDYIDIEERDKPGIYMDFHGIYDVEIVPESIFYDYKFRIDDYPEADLSGVSDDPINEYRKWVKSPEFTEAQTDRLEAELGKAGTEFSEEGIAVPAVPGMQHPKPPKIDIPIEKPGEWESPTEREPDILKPGPGGETVRLGPKVPEPEDEEAGIETRRRPTMPSKK
jgi:hypothetical protein